MKRYGYFVRRAVFGILASTLVLGLMALGVLVDRKVLSAYAPLKKIPDDAQPEFQLLAEAFNIIERHYVDRPAIQPRELTCGALGGMVDALGDTGHSTFMNPEMVEEEKDLSETQFEGIGVEIQMKDGHPVIVVPMDNSPAQKAGLVSGEIILGVDGRPVDDLSLKKVVSLIRGPAGTRVMLEIMNPETRLTRGVSIARASFTIHNVTWQILPDDSSGGTRAVEYLQEAGRGHLPGSQCPRLSEGDPPSTPGNKPASA